LFIAGHAGILALKDKISVIKSASVGKDFTGRSKGFTHGITVVFASRDGELWRWC
jgi:hypothetical protein